MKQALLLGPGHWNLPWTRPWRRFYLRNTPLEDRQDIRQWLAAQDVDAILLEFEPSLAGEDEDLAKKFHRVMSRNAFDAVVVYWPAGAKMQTTWDELVILREMALSSPVPPVHYLSQPGAMDLSDGRLVIHERGARSAYLRGVSQLPAQVWPWTNRRELTTATEWCGAKISGLAWPKGTAQPVELGREALPR